MKKILTLLMALLAFSNIVLANTHSKFSPTERAWLTRHKGETIKLSASMFLGKSYFDLYAEEKGYLFDVAKIIERELGMRVDIIPAYSWNISYNRLINNEAHLLFGANNTAERQSFMAFTSAIETNPYALIALTNGDVKTIGDTEGKIIGFFKSDIAIDLFESYYDKINIKVRTYESHPDIVKGLLNGEISAFVTQAGGIEIEQMIKYPDLKKIATLQRVQSDMTLSTLKENSALASIVNKIIADNRSEIDTAVAEAKVNYNYKLLKLSKRQVDWLNGQPTATVAVVEDYLPFDYYQNGEFGGISGELFKEISAATGIQFNYVYGRFDDLYTLAQHGDVDIINIAKTKERRQHFYFTRPLVEEIDVIYGKNQTDYINDIYGLEGKRVAVIEGFWHKELLEKNLTAVDIVYTKDIKQSLQYTSSGKVDYFIENPTVADYYISGLGYDDIAKKGVTASDSFIYLGINKQKPTLAAVIDRALMIIDYRQIKEHGIESIPEMTSLRSERMKVGIAILSVILIAISFLLYRAFKSLVRARETTVVLREREKLFYVDPLTKLNNRMLFNERQDDGSLGQNYTMIAMDLNNFKAINDNYGHLFGDYYLQTFAAQLAEHFVHDDIIRMGGDEFIVISEQTNPDRIDLSIATLRKRLSAVVLKNDAITMTGIEVAIGYHIANADNHQLDYVHAQADKAMYSDKLARRTR